MVLTAGFFVVDIPAWIAWLKWLSYLYYAMGELHWPPHGDHQGRGLADAQPQPSRDGWWYGVLCNSAVGSLSPGVQAASWEGSSTCL